MKTHPFHPPAIARTLLLAVALQGVNGCGPRRTPTTTLVEKSAPALLATLEPVEVRPKDARPAVLTVFQVEVYKISVPCKTLSVNEDFWKRVDETAVDVGTHDLLLNNGVRVGLLPGRELPAAKLLIEQYPSQTQRASVVAAEVKGVELDMTREVDSQDIFFFESDNPQPVGRSYDRSRNSVNLSFQPAPRKANTLRVSITPAVKSIRRRMEFTALNQELEKEASVMDRIYEMNLRADVPQDGVLVIAPSPDAWRSSSIGHAFFMNFSPSEQRELVILVMFKTVLATEAKPSTTDQK